MKNIAFALLLMISAQSFAQNYPDYGYPYQGSYDDDDNYFPEDYYYQYPRDYYTDAFYRDAYNDYRRSIKMVNWNHFFRTHRLSPWQIDQIIYLNQMYSSFARWDAYYRYNPERWYYDRFYALENILGPQIFIVFQNNYYHGYNPMVYYRDYCRNHYRPSVYVRPVYRNININIYRQNPRNYHRDHGYYYSQRNGFDFKDAPERLKNYNPGFRSSVSRNQNSNSAGFRDNDNQSGQRIPSSNNGFRNDIKKDAPRNSTNDNGFRNPGFKTEERAEDVNSGFRNPRPQVQDQQSRGNEKGSNNGFRGNSNRSNENKSFQQNENRRERSNSGTQKSSDAGSRNTNRNAGFRS